MKNKFIAFRATAKEREKVEQLADDLNTSITGVLSMLLSAAEIVEGVTALTVNGVVVGIRSTTNSEDTINDQFEDSEGN